MNKPTKFLFKIFSLLVITFLFACTTTKLDPKNPKGNLIISMERTPCFGRCPIYTISIYDDGLLLYNGKKFVDSVGLAYRQLSKAEMGKLKTAFEAADFFKLLKAYPDAERTPSDLPSCIVYYKNNGEEKTITDHRWKTPEALTAIEQTIDSVASFKLLQFYDN